MGFSKFYADSVTSIESYSTKYLKKRRVYRITWIGYLLNWISYHVFRIRAKFDGARLLAEASGNIRLATFGDGRKCLVKRSSRVLRPEASAAQNNYVTFALNDDPHCDISGMLNDVVSSLTAANDVRWKELVCIAYVEAIITYSDLISSYSGATVTAVTHVALFLHYGGDDPVVLCDRSDLRR
ncbi:hypothetical protein FOA52_004184 [Chlamydomonas sp. UWO 241]|nr:hypothetical protein FOA52_004184 [Chlamydomonas sp. UWO 241]